MQLGFAQRRIFVRIRAHGRHQHHFAHAAGFGLVDERSQQRVLVGMAGRGEQEGGVNALEGGLQAFAGEQIQLDLAAFAGRTAGGAAHLMALGCEQTAQHRTDCSARTDNKNT